MVIDTLIRRSRHWLPEREDTEPPAYASAARPLRCQLRDVAAATPAARAFSHYCCHAASYAAGCHCRCRRRYYATMPLRHMASYAMLTLIEMLFSMLLILFDYCYFPFLLCCYDATPAIMLLLALHYCLRYICHRQLICYYVIIDTLLMAAALFVTLGRRHLVPRISLITAVTPTDTFDGVAFFISTLPSHEMAFSSAADDTPGLHAADCFIADAAEGLPHAAADIYTISHYQHTETLPRPQPQRQWQGLPPA